MWWRSHGPTAPPGGVGPPCPSPSRLLAPGVFGENRDFAIISRVFPKSRFSAQNRDTRVILLKTALVRVSCIQITQIRGEATAKVFGKVDTFWTYHPAATPRLLPGFPLISSPLLPALLVFMCVWAQLLVLPTARCVTKMAV